MLTRPPTERQPKHRMRRVRESLRRAGMPENDERARFVGKWIKASATKDRQADVGLDQAVAVGVEIYDALMEQFGRYFSADNPPGRTHIRQALERRLQFSDDRLVDAVMERIWERREHLLHAFFAKYQGSLFDECRVQRNKVAGYFVRVAQIESRKLTPGQLKERQYQDLDYGNLPELSVPANDGPPNDTRAWLAELVRALRDFWTEENGFTAGQRLEGLVSVGLGVFSGDAEVSQRWDALVQKRMPRWEAELERLRRNASRALARWEEQREALSSCDLEQRPEIETGLARLEQRFQRLRERIDRHHLRLRPKPKEIARLLAGKVVNVGNIRHRRIKREESLLKQRVQRAGARLQTRPLSAMPAALVDDVLAHSGTELPSPSAHGLSSAERQRRRHARDVWGRQAMDLVQRIRALAAAQRPEGPGVESHAMTDWLADAEDYYEFAVLDRHGVLAALERRRGWRLLHLLRSADEETSR